MMEIKSSSMGTIEKKQVKNENENNERLKIQNNLNGAFSANTNK